MKTDYNVNRVKRDGRRAEELRKLSLTCSSVGKQACGDRGVPLQFCKRALDDGEVGVG